MADAKRKSLSVNKGLISGSVEDGLNQCLPSLLECPVCFEYMEPPIRMCRGGHNICQKCRPLLSNCPMCRKSFLLTRNFALETLADLCLEECGNVDVGCNFKRANVGDIEKHMEVCSYRLYRCEYGRPGGCSWLGRRWQILDHMREAHENILILLENNFCKITDFLLYDHDLTTQVIMAHGELFWFRHQKDSSKFKFFCAVQYIGPEENAAKYRYEIKFDWKNPSGMKFKFSRNTHKDTDFINDIFNSEDCLCVSTLMTEKFMGKDENLRFILKINKN